ncbi:MAG: hypothetical protein JNL88_07380 [Bacteroidia bacterium]|nr:hypothetical protein [Bacteroidia bacterium]
MRLIHTAIKQVTANYRAYLLALAIPGLLLTFAWFFGRMKGIELGDLTRDPNTVLKGHVYTGMISNAGIFFWSASATICLFTAALYRILRADKIKMLLMFFAGALSLVMGFDDVFQMHEKMFNDIRYIPEQLFFLAYALFMAFIVLVCYREFIQTDFTMWLMALGLFMISLLIDHDFIVIRNDHAFWEDSFKFAGIVAWTVYYLRTSMQYILSLKPEPGKS